MSLEGQTSPAGVVVGSTSGNGAPPPDVGGFDVDAARKAANALLADGADPSDPAAADAEHAKPAEPEKPKVGSEDELTQNWVRLRSQEARFKDRIGKERGALQADREAFAKEKAEHELEVNPYRESKTKAKSHPLAALQEMGWTFDQLMDYVSRKGQIPQERIIADLKLQFDEETTKTRAQLEEIKAEKAKAEHGQLVSKYEGAVEHEVKTTLSQYPHLERFVAKFGHERLMPKVFQQLHQNALQKNFLPPSQVLRSFEEELSTVAPLFGTPSPSPGGAGSGPANLEAAKPNPSPMPMSNDDGSEVGSSAVDDDEDLETLRKRAKAILAGG